MLRLTVRLVTKLAAVLRPRPPSPPAPTTLTQPPRTPDPYVWSLPNPRDARWRRWYRRTQHIPYKDRTDLLLPEEACWQPLVQTPPRSPIWTTTDDAVRLYVLLAMGEEQ